MAPEKYKFSIYTHTKHDNEIIIIIIIFRIIDVFEVIIAGPKKNHLSKQWHLALELE